MATNGVIATPAEVTVSLSDLAGYIHISMYPSSGESGMSIDVSHANCLLLIEELIHLLREA